MIDMTDFHLICAAQEWAKNAAEKEEAKFEAQRAKDFWAWAKKATTNGSRMAFKFAKLPVEWQPEAVVVNGMARYDDQAFVDKQADKWATVWGASDSEFPAPRASTRSGCAKAEAALGGRCPQSGRHLQMVHRNLCRRTPA